MDKRFTDGRKGNHFTGNKYNDITFIFSNIFCRHKINTFFNYPEEGHSKLSHYVIPACAGMTGIVTALR